MRLEIVGVPNGVGSTITVNLALYGVTNLFGMDVTCSVNPVVLQGISATGGDGFNSSNSFIVDRGYQADGTWKLAASRLKPNQPITGSALAFSLNYTLVGAGLSPINCTLMGADPEGRDVPIIVLPTQLDLGMSSAGSSPTPLPVTPSAVPTSVLPPTASSPATATPVPAPSSVSGVVRYPGATSHEGITAVLFRDGQLFAQTTTDAAGAYRFENVPAGAYIAAIGAPQSLVIQRAVTVVDGQATTLPEDVLTMGDTDNSGQIDLNDAALVGANLNLQSQAIPNADLNRDGIIDIRDLVLIGSSFGLVSPLTPP